MSAGPEDPMSEVACGGILPYLAACENDPAIWDTVSGWLTRAEVREKAGSLATRLAAPRKRLVFLLAANNVSAVIGLLGATQAGHAVALIDPSTGSEKLTQLIAAYRPDFILTTTPFETGMLDGFQQKFEGDRSFPAIAISSDEAQRENIASDLALLLSTSGTTGSAKFVRLAETAVRTNAHQIADALDITADSVGIAHLPLHYSYGLSVLTSHLVVGGRVVLMEDSMTSPSFWETIAATGGTHFPGVPFHYTVLARLGFDLVPDTVTTFTQAGGALDPRILNRMLPGFSQRSARFYVMYGQTEASPRMTTLPFQRLEEKAGSVGIALSGAKLTIVGDDDQSVACGQSGNVVYEGRNVMMGYAQSRADLSLGDDMDGRLETGDIGHLDSDGYLYLTGRTKRFAKIAGLRLSLDEIEAEIVDLGIVACLDVGDKVLILHEGDIADALRKRARSLASGYKIPPSSFAYRQVDAMPRKTSGKIDYARVKEMATDV